MVQEVGREQEERNGAKDRGGCGCQCRDVERQSTGLECSQWILWVLLVSLALL